MKRNAIKLLSNKLVDYIPKKYEGMDKDAEDIYDRPLTYLVKRLSRDDRYELISKMREEFGTDFKEEDLDNADKVEEMVKKSRLSMTGDAYRFVFESCVAGFKNAIFVSEENGEEVKLDETKDKKYVRAMWNSDSDDSELVDVVNYIIKISLLSGEESKNSPSPQGS